MVDISPYLFVLRQSNSFANSETTTVNEVKTARFVDAVFGR